MKKLFAVLFALVCVLDVQAASPRKWAVVGLSSNFLREEPSFTAENGAQTLMGTVVEVLGTQGYWVKVSAPDPYVAWTVDMSLAMMTEEEKDAYIAAPKWICVSEYSHIFKAPDAASARICDFTMGDLVRKTGGGAVNGWLQVMLPSGLCGWVPAADVRDFSEWADDPGFGILRLAERFVGTPYMWGGNSVKYFDCSGFASFVYRMNGILLPRNTGQQVKVGEEIPADFACMEPGDLIFFGPSRSPLKVSHVGIYMGNGMMIHASQCVRISSLKPGGQDYYDREILAVRRVLGHVGDGTGIIGIKQSPAYFKQ